MKKFKIVSVILGISILLSGCSGLDAKAATSEQEVKVTEVTESPTESAKKEAVGQSQKREAPDFTGEISEIIGNDLTLKLISMPQMSEASQQGTTKQDQVPKDAVTKEKDAPKAITGSTEGGFPGGGGFGGGPGGERGASKEGTASGNTRNKVALDLEYTGEEKTIILPVGMSITSGRGGQGVTFETLQKGNVLSIYLDDAGNVENVRLIGGGTQ